ncbi:hypothetical protein [Phenylobacterium koreense]|uniref:UrcA family protein n=1 Tax=Phenylobacterium koreense TaxID=266125 RepID=A0ABV2ELP0_9CAUL
MTQTRTPLRRPRSAVAPLAIAAALLSMGGLAQAQEVDSVSVSSARPTTLKVRIAGLDYGEVRQAVRTTARTVCRNAVTNHELEFFDIGSCAHKAGARALRAYDSAQPDRRLALNISTEGLAR